MIPTIELTVDQQYLKAKAGRSLFFDYTISKQFCEQCGLKWLGDDFIAGADKDAWLNAFMQAQVDVAMRHHLWQVKFLFSPGTYRWYQRLILAFYFLTGWKPK